MVVKHFSCSFFEIVRTQAHHKNPHLLSKALRGNTKAERKVMRERGRNNEKGKEETIMEND